jgi:mono/diheme cytochrome c family protein
VAIQALLTSNLFKLTDVEAVTRTANAPEAPRGVQEIARQILRAPKPLTFGGRGANLPADQQAILQRGATIYNELCASCHAPDGRGMPVQGSPARTMAPPLLTSARTQGHRDYAIETILHGLTGPVDGTTYADVMVPMDTNSDEWIASVASYVRSGFGNSNWLVTPADVARVRASSTRRSPWTVGELEASLPRAVIPDAAWRATASHNPETAAGGLNFSGWSSGRPQQPDMWFQIELPAPMTLTEIQFESPVQGGGRGGPPPAGTFPRAYRVQVSADGRDWSAPVAEGRGNAATTVIAFPSVRAKLVRITQTGTDETAPWTIQRLRVFEKR